MRNRSGGQAKPKSFSLTQERQDRNMERRPLRLPNTKVRLITKSQLAMRQDQDLPSREAGPTEDSILDILPPLEQPPLQLVRLDENETIVIPFTPYMKLVDLHYCEEREIRGYVRHNAASCTLCTVGKKRRQFCLLPVYLPVLGAIGVLMVKPSREPHDLLPLIDPILRAEKPVVTFITREDFKFSVSTVPLTEDMDGGDTIIQQFLDDYQAGRIDLTSVLRSFDNEQLAEVPAIARVLSFKKG
jgi:hypothetical protein